MGVVAFIGVLLVPAAAGAQSPVEPTPGPSIEQYRESVPAVDGQRPASRSRADRRAQRSAADRAELRREAGAEADDLDAIASDPGLGAPAASPPSRDGNGKDRRSPGEDRPGGASRAPADVEGVPTAAAAAEAAVGTGSSTTVWLLVGLVVVAAGVGAGALARRRRVPSP